MVTNLTQGIAASYHLPQPIVHLTINMYGLSSAAVPSDYTVDMEPNDFVFVLKNEGCLKGDVLQTSHEQHSSSAKVKIKILSNERCG
jgi:hypothetical protein